MRRVLFSFRPRSKQPVRKTQMYDYDVLPSDWIVNPLYSFMPGNIFHKSRASKPHYYVRDDDERRREDSFYLIDDDGGD